MAPSRSLLTTIPLMAFGLLLLTSCGSQDTTAQTCHRLIALQEEIAVFETFPTGDPTQRVETVRGFAHELDRIRIAASNAQLESTAETLAEMYRSLAEVAAAQPHLSAVELITEVEPHLEIDRINTANANYIQICQS
jgi:hypothetical protein